MTASPNDADRRGGETKASKAPSTTPEPTPVTGSGEGSNTRAGDDEGGSASGLEHAATAPTGGPVPPADKNAAGAEQKSFGDSPGGAGGDSSDTVGTKAQPQAEPGPGKRMATDEPAEKEPDPPGRDAAQAASGHTPE
jgi:hypothetical protein